jgi:dUTP pyrophosphatase
MPGIFTNPLSAFGPLKQNLTFFKEFEGAVTPERGSAGAAGIDFFIPKPTSTDDKCFEFMRNKCLEAVKDNDNEARVINIRFDEYKKMDPERGFLEAVVQYNARLFGHIFKLAFPSASTNSIQIAPGESITIPTGISASIPHGFCLQFLNKSGIATKNDLIVGAELVDEDYKGIMHINLHNVGNSTRTLKCGQKIVQGVMHMTYWDLLDVTVVNGHINETSERGEGGFGSTGTEAK